MFALNNNSRFRLFLTVALLLGGTGLLYLFFNQFRNSLIDDTFITFGYASTLRNYFEWGFYHGLTSNTATSPLNVVLIALFNIFISDVISAALLLTAVEAIGIIVCLFKLCQHEYQNNLFAMIAAIGTILNPLLLSTIGLESFLFCLLFSCSLLCLITQSPKQLGISLGLLTLTRPEGCLFFVFFLGYYILHHTMRMPKIRTAFQIAIPYILTIAPWFLFSWIHLGSFVPDTLFIKIHQNWGGNILTGISLYLTKFPFETMIAFIFIPIAVVFFRWTKETFRYLLPSCIVAYFLCYLFLDVPPYHWYYTPIVYISILMGSYGLSVFALNRKKLFGGIAGIMGFAVPLLGFIAIISFRPAIPAKEAFIYSNWASQNQYRNIAQWLSDSIATTRPIILNGEAGTIPFFCKQRVTNYFTIGIDDSIIVTRFHKTSAISRLCASINHFFWKPRNYQTLPEWVIRLNPDPRDTIQLSKDRKYWFLISRFDSAGIGIARLFSIKGNENY